MITREDVVRTVRAALVDDAGMPASWFPREGGLVVEAVTNAVMSLIERDAAVPTMAKQEARRLKGVLRNHPRAEYVRMTRLNAEFLADALLGEKR